MRLPRRLLPEQAKGKPVDRRADIWAFGCPSTFLRTLRARRFEAPPAAVKRGSEPYRWASSYMGLITLMTACRATCGRFMEAGRSGGWGCTRPDEAFSRS